MSASRREREIDYIMTINAVEAYSVLVKPIHCESLWFFLQSKGLRGMVENNAISGDDPHNDIQIAKDVSFEKFNSLVGEWKKIYMNS